MSGELRHGLVGYFSDEVQIKEVEVKDVKIKMRVKQHDVVRKVEQVSLGPHFCGAAAPHVDTSDPLTLRDGVKNRIGRKMPDRKPGFLRKLRWYVKAQIEKFGLRPVSPEEDFDFETWLNNTNYEQWRKDELRKINDDVISLLERNDAGELKNFKVKLFAKQETYMTWKHARGIYAREDVAKIFFGPMFKKIEEAVYYDPSTGEGIEHFIKHVAVDQRVDYIMEKVYKEGYMNVFTDYTSLEAHFDAPLMENCEFLLYEHMLGSNPRGRLGLEIMREVLQGTNIVQNRFMSVLIEAMRMSGEMNTSLGNGWSNLMLFGFWCAQRGIPVIGVVEGDDGLFSVPPWVVLPTEEWFKSRGCIIKVGTVEDISRASFCGLLFDPVDKAIISDPFKILANFGYTNARYALSNKKKLKALLRAKAMSMLVQYWGCPIVATLATKMLELTRSYNVDHVIAAERDSWRREKLIYGMKNYKSYVGREIGMRTRLLFEEIYGITVETQISIENRIKQMTVIAPLRFDEILPLFPYSFLENWERYSCTLRAGDKNKIFFVHTPIKS